MAGAALWPKANRTAQWFGKVYPGSPFSAVEKLVLHTTEGSGWPAYSGGASAPHFTGRLNYSAKVIEWRQHFVVTASARALMNAPGGVQTNLDGAVQVELIGTCDPSSKATPYWPAAPLWALAGVAELVAWLHAEHGLALRAAPRWLPYPSSYGRTSARMAGKEWDAFRGVVGHQHVPENDHGDPGDFPIAAVLAYAAGARGSASIPTEEDDMPLTKQDLDAIASAVWGATFGSATETAGARLARASSPEAIAAAVAGKLVAAGWSPEDPGVESVKQAVREVLRDGVGS
jgi:hypothetical protein